MHRTGSMEHRWSPSQTMHPGSTGLTMVRQPSGGMPRALSAALDREMSGQLPPSVVPIVPARPGSGIPGHALELDPARWVSHAPVLKLTLVRVDQVNGRDLCTTAVLFAGQMLLMSADSHTLELARSAPTCSPVLQISNLVQPCTAN